MILIALFVCGCAFLRPPLKEFPAERGSAQLRALKPAILSLYQFEVPRVDALKISVRNSDWQIDRHPASGAIIRRCVHVWVGYRSKKNPDSCWVEAVSYAQKHLGGGRWSHLKFYGVGMEPSRKIACDLLL